MLSNWMYICLYPHLRVSLHGLFSFVSICKRDCEVFPLAATGAAIFKALPRTAFLDLRFRVDQVLKNLLRCRARF